MKPRWILVGTQIEFDGVAIFSSEWPIQWGRWSPEQVVELLNDVTVDGVCEACLACRRKLHVVIPTNCGSV